MLISLALFPRDNIFTKMYVKSNESLSLAELGQRTCAS